jgi:excisionase family DNA binding protein
LLTAPQAARRTGKSRHTIERWARTGRIRGRLVGGRWLIYAASLDRAGQS